MGNGVIQVLNGLTTAGELFLVAAGLTLVFGAMRLINIAHGSLYMYGAFLTAVLIGTDAERFWLALVIAPIAVAVLGIVCELTVMRRLYGKEHLTQLVATFALFLILGDISLRLWHGSFRAAPRPRLLSGNVTVLGRDFPQYNLFVMGVAIVVGVLLWLLLARSRFGWRVRAAAEDTETLAVVGTDVRLLASAVFGLGALLAGLGGAVIAPLVTVSQGLGSSIIVEAFIVTVIGGLGSVAGAAIGAIVIGVFTSIGVIWVPTWSSTFIYLALILVLAFRPWGLLGRAER